MRGSRRVRSDSPPRLASSSVSGILERAEPALPDEPLVDPAQAAAERRVDGHAERDRFAVHRPAGRDDEIGEGDEALRVHGAVGHDDRGKREPAHVVALLVGSRDDHGLDALLRGRAARGAAGRADSTSGGRGRCRAVCARGRARWTRRGRAGRARRGRARSRRGSTPPSGPGTCGASAAGRRSARAARAGSPPARGRASRPGSRAGAGPWRTRSRRCSHSGFRVTARPASGGASRGPARRRSRAPSPRSGAPAGG